MERIIRLLRLVFRNIYYYRVDYIRTFVVIRLFQILIVIPLTTLLFTSMLHLIGIQSVTEQNIWQLLKHPLVLTVLVFIVLIFLIFIYYEMGFLMLLAYHQQRAIPYTLKGLWKRLNQKVLHFMSFQTIFFVVYLMLVIPLISSVLPLSITQNLQIPRFIVDELLTSTKGQLLYYGAITVILVVGLRFIFTLPFFTVYHSTSIWQAVKMSWQFSQRKLIETLSMLALIVIVHVTITATILVIIFVPLYIVERLLPGNALVVAAFTLTLAEGFLVLAFTFLQAVFSQILVLVSFKLTHEKPLIIQNESFRKTILHWTIIIGIFMYFLISGLNIINLQKTVYEPTTKIIAHRGFMEKGVENTLSSLIASAEAGADMVEIDIQQTKDGKFIVFHDASLTRLAGKKESVYQMTQAELMEVTVHSGQLSDTIPSLEQMLEKSRELNIQLLIEIKTHGYETDDMLQRLIAMLDQYKALDVHYIQSLEMDIAIQIKEMEPRLKVGVVYALNLGALPKTDLDFIAIEQYFVTERLIEQAKQQEKQLFVWTVNDTRGLQKYLEQNIDGIITNYPDETNNLREVLNEDQYFLSRIWNKINYIF